MACTLCVHQQGHSCRSENLDMAISLDDRTAEAWIGHPYFDVIDNSTEFDTKIRRMISVSAFLYNNSFVFFAQFQFLTFSMEIEQHSSSVANGSEKLTNTRLKMSLWFLSSFLQQKLIPSCQKTIFFYFFCSFNVTDFLQYLRPFAKEWDWTLGTVSRRTLAKSSSSSAVYCRPIPNSRRSRTLTSSTITCKPIRGRRKPGCGSADRKVLFVSTLSFHDRIDGPYPFLQIAGVTRSQCDAPRFTAKS